jgi:ABC-type phosphate/phosphonate transport system ATPase subunit
VRRVELELAPGLVVEFVDRERALGQVEEFAEEGTRWPVVVFGPEGCGETAFLRQVAAMLRDLGYDVFYLHPRTGFFRRRWTTQTSRGSSLTS